MSRPHSLGCDAGKHAAQRPASGGTVVSDSGETAELRFLALGDSYTIGEGVQTTERWPVQLARLLRDEGVAIGEPEIVAKTGWTTAELTAGIDRAKPAGAYDLVSLLIGVNNQYRGRSDVEYRRELAKLLDQAVGFAGGERSHVIVLSIPDWSVTPFARNSDRSRIRAEIDRFNAVNREEAERAGAQYVDVTGISRMAADDKSLLAADGLHPSGKMYREWAKLVLPIARRVARP